MEDVRREELLKAEGQQAAKKYVHATEPTVAFWDVQTTAPVGSKPSYSPLQALVESHFEAQRRHGRTARAIDFLERNPAFNEFLELQREGIL